MTPDPIAQHEFDDGSVIQLVRNLYGSEFALVGEFGGLETTVQFDRVSTQRNDLVLSKEVTHGPPGHHIASGSLEGDYADYGAVGDALYRIARELPASELEAMLDA